MLLLRARGLSRLQPHEGDAEEEVLAQIAEAHASRCQAISACVAGRSSAETGPGTLRACGEHNSARLRRTTSCTNSGKNGCPQFLAIATCTRHARMVFQREARCRAVGRIELSNPACPLEQPNSRAPFEPRLISNARNLALATKRLSRLQSPSYLCARKH